MAIDDRDRIIAALAGLAGDPGRWDAADPEELRQAMFLGLMHYGATNDPAEVPRLVPLYSAVVRRSTVDERMKLLEYVTDAVAGQVASGNALMPFIMVDPEHQVVSTAALNLAVLTPGNDPLAGPREVLRIAVEDVMDIQQDTRTSILAGLILLGDRRVLALLGRCWELVDEQHRHALARAKSQFVYAGVVDFCLDWLDACLESGDESLFGTVAAQLAMMPLRPSVGPQVVEMERVMPVWAAGGGPPVRHRQSWTFAEYGRVIEPRLRDLLARESEPKVLPHVMEMWGLGA